VPKEATLDTAIRDERCARLRAQGHTYRQIAACEGIGLQTAHKSVKRALAAVPVEAVNELRQIESERLNRVISTAFGIVETSHPVVSHGRVMEGLEDTGPILSALALIVRTSESIRKLYGLDAPARQTITVLTEDAVDAELRRLEHELAALDQLDAATQG
jgi:hypothetical protein